MANNHWGDIERAYTIIDQFSAVVRNNQVRAAIKLQLRNVESYIHPRFIGLGGTERLARLSGLDRYIQKVMRTRLSRDDLALAVQLIRERGCIPLATVFDEESVELTSELDLPAVKLASSSIDDWPLIRRIGSLGKPTIVSTGGASLSAITEVVEYLGKRDIALAINHCVSIYPSEDKQLALNQIDVLRRAFPSVTVGFSTHEYTDWDSSMLISYAKGARTWERHVDIPYPPGHEQTDVSAYCSLPHQIDRWFRAFHRAKAMCGPVNVTGRTVDPQETAYLGVLRRGLYFARDVEANEIISERDVYAAIPLLSEIGQLPSGSLMANSWRTKSRCNKDDPILVANVHQV